MEGIYDIHTHIIPDVDDGAKTIEESMQIIQNEVDQGVAGIILTPHFRKYMFETPEDKIYIQCKKLLSEVEKQFPELQVGLGCEFHAIMNLEEEIEKRMFSTINRSSTLLLEFSGRHAKSFMKERTETCLRLGYSPILAHVERFPAFYSDPFLVDHMRKIGAGIQINADSVLGYDGTKIQSFCKKLLKSHKVDYIASDVHNMKDRSSHIGECFEFVKDKYGSDYAYRIFVDNPQMLF